MTGTDEVISKVEKGDGVLVASTASGYTAYTVTSGRVFRLKSLILTNISGMATVSIYDSASSSGETVSKRFPVIAKAAETTILEEEQLHGADYLSSVVVFSNVSGLYARVGGVEF